MKLKTQAATESKPAAFGPPIDCSRCHYFAFEAKQPVCRRNPPTVVPFDGPHPEFARAAFPNVSLTSWCGEWRRSTWPTEPKDAVFP